MFSELNATDFFLEDGLADQISEQAIASIFVFFIPVHEISEEKGEIEDEHEEGSHANAEYFLG